MFAKTEYINVFNDHHFVIVFVVEGIIDQFIDVDIDQWEQPPFVMENDIMEAEAEEGSMSLKVNFNDSGERGVTHHRLPSRLRRAGGHSFFFSYIRTFFLAYIKPSAIARTP